MYELNERGGWIIPDNTEIPAGTEKKLAWVLNLLDKAFCFSVARGKTFAFFSWFLFIFIFTASIYAGLMAPLLFLGLTWVQLVAGAVGSGVGSGLVNGLVVAIKYA